MTLTKHKMIAEIGRRTRLKNRDVQLMLEALIDVWTDALVYDGRIELEKLFVIEIRTIDRGEQTGSLNRGQNQFNPPRQIRRAIFRSSKHLKNLLRD